MSEEQMAENEEIRGIDKTLDEAVFNHYATKVGAEVLRLIYTKEKPVVVERVEDEEGALLTIDTVVDVENPEPDLLLAYSEWLDGQNLVVSDKDGDDRTHDQLVSDFLEQDDA